MKKIFSFFSIFCILLFSLCGCNMIGEKSMSLSVIYVATTALSLALLSSYCSLAKNKDLWFLLLFSAVFVTNAGYLTLSLSMTVSEALLANRIAYLGSAYLMLAMLMIVINVSLGSCKRWITCALTGISSFVFLVAASPGYLDIYYRSVTLEFINGVTVLNKTYGPWHKLYLYYLLSYFAAMVAVILYAFIKKKIPSVMYAISLLAATTVNLCVWLLGQLVRIDFEFLSVSYIISELFLLCITLLRVEDKQVLPAPIPEESMEQPLPEVVDEAPVFDDESAQFRTQCEFFASQLCTLTPTEHSIYELYLNGKSSREIMDELSIKENTLKYHNKNIYSKLGISSRKQLLEIASAVNAHNED